eukprot:13204735-Alexandrium_andersonii.AAC.1
MLPRASARMYADGGPAEDPEVHPGGDENSLPWKTFVNRKEKTARACFGDWPGCAVTLAIASVANEPFGKLSARIEFNDHQRRGYLECLSTQKPIQ